MMESEVVGSGQRYLASPGHQNHLANFNRAPSDLNGDYLVLISLMWDFPGHHDC